MSFNLAFSYLLCCFHSNFLLPSRTSLFYPPFSLLPSSTLFYPHLPSSSLLYPLLPSSSLFFPLLPGALPPSCITPHVYIVHCVN